MREFSTQAWRYLLQQGILPAERNTRADAGVICCECYLAGLAHHGGAEMLHSLFSGQPLYIQREPDNAFDARAVAFYTQSRHKLGYIPRSNNTRPALLLDRGAALGASIVHIDTLAQLHRAVRIALYHLVPRI